jgi:flavin-dependent dehydrogenase
VLDALLVEAAASAGAEVRDGFAVDDLLRDGERVTGIRGRELSGRTVEERATLVVGADGLHSCVARGVNAGVTLERPPLTIAYYSYWSGVVIEDVEIYPRPGHAIVAFPTNGSLALVAVFRREGDPAARGDVESAHRSALQSAPDLAARVAAGRREERFAGASGLRNIFRVSHGPGWALAGDAGYHKDPLTARGITDAFTDADRLSDAIDAGLSGRSSFDAALAAWERERNEESMPLFELTCQRATLDPPPPDAVALLAALAGNQEQIDRFVGVDSGAVAVADFFSPANVGRIMARGGAVT